VSNARAKAYLRGAVAWHRATGLRGVVMGHFIQPPDSPLVGVDFGEGILLCDPVILTDSPPPDTHEPWQHHASE